MSVNAVIKSEANLLLKNLNEYEREEIKTYRQSAIYFTGGKITKHIPERSLFREHDYSSFEGFYRIVLNDHLDYRFEVLRSLGRGYNGEVVEALDHKMKRSVAIKIVRGRPRFNSKADIEMMIHEHLEECNKGSSSSVVKLIETFDFRGHNCLVFELLHIDLDQALVNNRKGFELPVLKDIMISLFRGLVEIHGANVIHCDLKPANIAFETEGHLKVKILDLGNSRIGKQVYTGEETTRYYRAPEIILHEAYGTEIDIWSMGCIGVELFTSDILFRGDGSVDQLSCIIETLGLPPLDMVNISPVRRELFFQDNFPRYCTTRVGKHGITMRETLNRFGNMRGVPGSRSLNSILKDVDPEFIDFIRNCLMWNPKGRMTAKEALQHPWIINDVQIQNTKNLETAIVKPPLSKL